MKNTKHLIVLFILFAQTAFSQITVKGTVKDPEGNLLPGASVLEKGTTNGFSTNFDGEYVLRVANKQSVLIFSYLGYKQLEVAVKDQTEINVTLEEDDNQLGEIVLVGFGKQKKESLVSSITTINPSELQAPTSNLTTMMAGRVAGMIAFQRSGEPGANNSDFFIRGLGSFGSGKVNPLILIDGIESTQTDMARLQPDDIESFSVLKDAAASAIYGARGANGVVLISTKSGKIGAAKFDVRIENRFSSNTDNFKLADNITYMRLANEANLTRDPLSQLPYSQNKIERTAAGDNPLLYPNNNWIDQLIKEYTWNQAFNISASGGAERARYYVAGTFNIDNGLIRENNLNGVSNNIKLYNYSLRSNINLQLTPTTEAIVRLYGQFDDYTGPIGGGQRVFNTALYSNPVLFPAIYPKELLPFTTHPLFGGAETRPGSGVLALNPYAEATSGFQNYKNSTLQVQLEFKQELDMLTEGLSARAMGYIRRFQFFDVRRGFNPFYYSSRRNPENGEIILNVINDGSEGAIGGINGAGTEFLDYQPGVKNLDSRIYLETALNYNRTFNDVHNISGMLINLISSYQTGNAGTLQASLPSRNHGLSGRFTYDYDTRYLFEFNFGYNGSERFASGKRYGFFPSFGLAYRISNEKFFEPYKETVTDLKLRATFGTVGNDEIGAATDRFFYLSDVNLNNGTYGATFGEEFGFSRPGVSTRRYANPNITWEKSQQLNIGVDVGLYKSLTVNADYFKQVRSNILQARADVGSTLGLQATPATNFGKAESEGFELSLDYNKQFGRDWWTSLRANMTYSTSKILQNAEIDYPDELSYLKRKGNSISQTYGLIAERLFIDDEEVANSPTQFGEVRGGDIKYRDVNGDGVISNSDRVPIGLPQVPELIYGFGGTVGYKNFDLSLFFQGSGRSSFFINPSLIQPFFINGRSESGLLKAIADSHWSEDNRDIYAFWPRLSTNQEVNNNQTSTWWMRNGSFLRLKNIEFGYNPPEKIYKKLGLKNLRVYASAINVAVWSSFDLWDPEQGANGLGYPIQGVYNFGLTARF
ncbi:TonB-dependent receptor [Polaribacter aestuariivivens]|uniref:TonB-dependent receptor n=1 Tax=Polaribacter aestuariivivens TaxID=2304626 RepID=A0A5S3NC85_9FLAO|nr:TonB-dependent receptor [Polaribacter aestuariivivens]TMM30606.1 TonB-dependent receptor [Polaribacter aestuariivivens]